MRFVRAFLEQGKPVGAICHGIWSLVETGVVNGRTVTSSPSSMGVHEEHAEATEEAVRS